MTLLGKINPVFEQEMETFLLKYKDEYKPQKTVILY